MTLQGACNLALCMPQPGGVKGPVRCGKTATGWSADTPRCDALLVLILWRNDSWSAA